MRFYIGVENFAKIESAEICVNRYTLLVGPNNSGKTFLMQLAQGVSDFFENLIDEEELSKLSVKQDNVCEIFELTADTILDCIELINRKLIEKKETIVKETFGNDIPIENLYIRIEFEEGEEYRIYQFQNVSEVRTVLPDLGIWEDFFSNIHDEFPVSIMKKIKSKEESPIIRIMFGMKNVQNVIAKKILAEFLNERSFFMPASRNGLMILYREFFAHKTDDIISFTANGSKIEKQQGRNLGLTQPVYNFLRFLQTYNFSDSSVEWKYTEELKFYDNKIIEGHISINEQGVLSYSPKEEGTINVPLYLASSMVNEVAPLYMALTSDKIYDRLIIDEIEASLHPEKQMELVRFLNRVHNKGFNFIISTHSDTFVSKLNNLCVLSEYIKKSGNTSELRKLGLSSDDIIPLNNLFVYEFINHSDGKSTVEKIPFNEKLGYQFDLFTGSALKLYNEAAKIQEIISNEG